ncbi:MAG: FAD-binding oxidoreductase [Spirulina sp. SIO3F2]|nr:FAD-binding oxidoreductase [Spirulina sp. SIO3F2]
MPDWLVIGGGITGAALAYELVHQGFSVALIDSETPELTATDCSYGGLAHWAGTTPLMRQLCQDGLTQYRHLTDELTAETGFRETQLLLTIPIGAEPAAIAAQYERFAIAPHLLSPQQAQELEPILNPDAIAAALRLPHAHMHPTQTCQAYLQAFKRQGGRIVRDHVQQWLQKRGRIVGVQTPTQHYQSDRVVLCAGGWSRGLLTQLGLSPSIYFTHAEILEGIAPPGTVQGMIMPAQLQRLALEQAATQPEQQAYWQEPGQQLAPSILDLGLVQFADGTVRLGQISRTLSDLDAPIDAPASAHRLRQAAAELFPALDTTNYRWRHCLVAFPTQPFLPVGAIPTQPSLHLFSGFGNALLLTPPLARHFAAWAAQGHDPVMAALQTDLKIP